MRIALSVLVILLLIVGCATPGPRISPQEVRDPSYDTSLQSQGLTVPVLKFYPFSYPIDTAIKWLSSVLPGGTAKPPK
jgi:hypothetical protein